MIKLSIGGRLIIPIRAIPEVTGRGIPPDEIATILAEKAPRWRPKVSLTSYHYEQDKSFNPILPRDWDVAIRDLITLRNKLELNQEIPDENHPVWREESIKRLLPRAFSWWDEFEAMHEKLFSERITELLGGRSGDRLINSNPPISSEVHELVYEGFERHPDYVAGMSDEDSQPAAAEQTTPPLEYSHEQEWIRRGFESLVEEKANEKKITPGRVKQKERTKRRHEGWRDEADKLWAMNIHAGKTKSEIARLIARRKIGDGASISTIRHVIRKKREKIVGEKYFRQMEPLNGYVLQATHSVKSQLLGK